MVTIGYFLSCEEFGPHELVRQAEMAEQAGFERLWISDHFHPWNDDQGNSPFVWSVIGALSQVTTLPITTAVTCPILRIHPAIVAQAAATAALQCEQRFALGVGSGEALNEHVFGDRWPPADVRLDMLEEAVEVIRELLTGRQVTHRGNHFTVENARLYTVPPEPVPIYVSAFGRRAAQLAGRIGDGFASTLADHDLVRTFRDNGGGRGPAQAGFKVCWADTADEALGTAHQRWAHEQLPGQLAQVLCTPHQFEQASSLVSREAVERAVPCGPEIERPLDMIERFADCGYDEVYVQQIGPDQDSFFQAWQQHVLPRIRSS
ncbi:TIGR03557 family F420-dependent LLM class oxidoreductase [Saccharopolyspora griseoalba]|uniref:TIGR03557 family F420-dependent LLM class oxidoreductase n=1 Tax=Saccharopolyspora griseoalba TaxID=1431848 RepID=A0ABW2LRW0_9PSEU